MVRPLRDVTPLRPRYLTLLSEAARDSGAHFGRAAFVTHSLARS